MIRRRTERSITDHGVDVADALEGVVQASVRHLRQHLLDRPLVVLRVHKLGDAEWLTWDTAGGR